MTSYIGEYEHIKKEVMNSKVANADETGLKVKSKKTWAWAFSTLTAVLFMIRPSRGQGPIKEALGENYQGILGYDGLKRYPECVKRLQRCWAHLLREAKVKAETLRGQAELLYQGLKKIFKRISKITVDTCQDVRTRTFNWCVKELDSWIKHCKHHKELKKFAGKIENGKQYWFTCVQHQQVEPTNNRAERDLREIVVQRKISSLWNEKGVRIKETVMSVLTTWKLQELNTFTMLRSNLCS